MISHEFTYNYADNDGLNYESLLKLLKNERDRLKKVGPHGENYWLRLAYANILLINCNIASNLKNEAYDEFLY